MTPQEVGTVLGGAASVSGGGAWSRVTVDVPVTGWAPAVRAARDDLGCDFLDWLSAVDEVDEGFRVVAHLWSTAGRTGLLLRTLVPRETAAVPSIVDIFAGAGWHERETFEMFGIDFPGHPGGLRPLLLPPEFEGHPLRKEFILASRVAKAWPGAKEPGESHDPNAARRAPMRPPGVPAPGEWGPSASGSDRDRPARARQEHGRPTLARQEQDRQEQGRAVAGSEVAGPEPVEEAPT